jgi:hypothetical protein
MVPKSGRRLSDRIMRRKKGQRTVPAIMRQTKES